MMDTLAEDFLAWAGDAGRSVEELFGAEVLVEGVCQRFAHAAGLPYENFDGMMRRREARKFNPAYVPEVPRWKLEFAAGKLGEVRALTLGCHSYDRPLRDLSALRFVPGLEDLRLDSVEREDLEGLRHVPGLRKLFIWSWELEDYSEIGACRGLRELDVFCFHLCPTLAGLDGLPELAELKWRGPVQALSTVRSLPALRRLKMRVDFMQPGRGGLVRDLHALPEMPLLREMWGGWFQRLDGVERFPELRFLTVLTNAKDLGKLAALQGLTHLRVSAPKLERLDEAARLPGLVHFALHSDRPQDWGVMMDCGTLREVFHFTDYKTQADLGMLRLVLPDADDLFAAAEPRPLAPLRLAAAGSEEDKTVRDVMPDASFPEGPDGWDDNPGMRETELHWVAARLRDALRDAGFLKLQGLRFREAERGAFQLFSYQYGGCRARSVMLRLLKTEAIAKAPEIVECLRKALAGLRFRWQIHVHMDAEPDADVWDESWRDVEESEDVLARREKEDELYREFERERKRILLEDELRLRMMKELGEDLSAFKPSPRPAKPGEPQNAPEPEEEKPDDDGPGGAAECDPDKEAKDEHWLPPVKITDPNAVWRDLSCFFEFDEEAIYMHEKNHGLEHIRDLFDLP